MSSGRASPDSVAIRARIGDRVSNMTNIASGVAGASVRQTSADPIITRNGSGKAIAATAPISASVANKTNIGLRFANRVISGGKAQNRAEIANRAVETVFKLGLRMPT